MNKEENEERKVELLRAYKEVVEVFDNIIYLIRKRIEYEHWPQELQIAGMTYESKDNLAINSVIC